MKFKYYNILQGDTLESISKKFNTTSYEIRYFHNLNAKLSDLIGDNIPKHLKKVIIPLNETYQVRDENNSIDKLILSHLPYDTKYQINQKIDMRVKGSSLIDSETEMIWENSKRIENELIAVNIKQCSHQIKYVKSMYRPLLEYMQKLNKPIEDVYVKLNQTGKIADIINQKEIFQKWLILREELQGEMGNTEEEKKILEGGDKDFSDSKELFSKNLIYQIFFPEIYSEEFNLNDTFQLLKSNTYTSQIFSFEEIKTSVKQKIQKIENNYISIKYLTESTTNQNKEIREIYDSKLKEFLGQEMDYQLSWTTEYTFDLENSKMIRSKSKIRESANDQYTHTTEFEISELN